MGTLVDYQPVDSPVHALNPLTKMVGALVVLVLSLVFTNYLYLAAVLAAVLALAGISKVFTALSRLFKGLLVFALILFLLQVFFYDDGRVLFHLIPVGRGYLAITDRGVLLGIAMSFRMLAILTSFLLFLATTRTQDIMHTLVERFGVPNDIAFMVLTSIRFIPTFLAEAKQISDAQRARAFVNEGWNPVTKVKAYLPVAVPLVLLSLKKAQQMVLAMETRGYGSGPRSHLRESKLKAGDFAVMGCLVALTALGLGLRLKGLGV